MKKIITSLTPIGENYPISTGRLKYVIGPTSLAPKKIALLGDSTLDNGYWVEKNNSYINKTHTVTHQAALALACKDEPKSYVIANFAVDGATTADLMQTCPLNKVLPSDPDHPNKKVHQLDAAAQWSPDIAVLSVAGNNYREALRGTLKTQLTDTQLLLRITPENARSEIRNVFAKVKANILEEYKKIIDDLIQRNPTLNRMVLLSQYFPSITEFTPYFIYTGFSHLARSEGKGQDPFTAVEETMNELYREILKYAATKNKEIVFVDVTSSLNPLGGNHTKQIEPNEKGSKIMGQLIAQAVEYTFPEEELQNTQKPIAILRMNADEQRVQSQLLHLENIDTLRVKKIEQFIRENRYRHLGLLFSPSSSLNFRYENAYHLIMGKQFDTEYTGLFAFGVLDLSLVTVLASYLWRVAVNDQIHISLRATAGVIAAPILLTKLVLGLAVMLLLALPILAYDKMVRFFSGPEQHQTKPITEGFFSSRAELKEAATPEDLTEDGLYTAQNQL